MAVRPRRISFDSRSAAVERLERLAFPAHLASDAPMPDVPPPGAGWVPDDLPIVGAPPSDDRPAGGAEVLAQPASHLNRRAGGPEHAAEPIRGRTWSLPGRLDGITAEYAQQRLLLGALTGRAAWALVVVVVLAAALTAVAVYLQRPRSHALPAVPAVESVSAAATVTPEPTGPPGGGGVGATTGGSAGSPVVVAVAGKVRRPGLIRLPAGARVDDAVRAAGGPLPGTDIGLLNLARVLNDGEQVVVGVPSPASGSSAPAGGAPAGGAPAAGAAGSPVDLNTATLETLDGLPGVGPVLAQRIVEWRAANGPFTSVEQLRDVSGIGDKKFEDLRSQVRV